MRSAMIASTLVGLALVALSGSIAYAGLPPTVLWQDNFTGQTSGTSISTLGWSTIPGTNALTSYQILYYTTFGPPNYTVRAWGMGVNAVYGLYQSVSGMEAYDSQIFHFKAHQANGVSTTMYDEVRVQTSTGIVLYWRIAERQAYALVYDPYHTPNEYYSTYIGDWASDGLWHDFDIAYVGRTGPQTVTWKLDGVTKFSQLVPNDLGHISQVQFVQQGGAKAGQPNGDSHLMGEMAVGSCTPPAPPTGIAASPATICSGASSTLSVNAPGAGLTTDWFTVACGGTPVPGGAGVNSVVVSPASTTTYYALTRNTTSGCVSACQSVTVTIPNCNDGNACTTDTCSNGVCSHTDSSGNACDDGDACTENDTCQAGACAGTPIIPCTGNGFDPDWILVIRGGALESEVRVLDESAPNVMTSDLGVLGAPEWNTYPKAVMTPHTDALGGAQDASYLKSLCFSNSPVAGVNSPAGPRLFGVYDVRSLDEPGPDGSDNDWSWYSVGFQIVELQVASSPGPQGVKARRIRVMQVGLAATMFYGDPDPTKNNHSPDLLVAPWSMDGCGGCSTRHTTAGCRVGTIRWNQAKNTLCVAANIGDYDIGNPCHPPVGRVYEFELPDWPVEYYPADHPIAELRNEPIPVSDPEKVRLVQIYEMPSRCETAEGTRYDLNRCECQDLGGTWYGHSISQENGGIGKLEGQRPVIAIDDDGIMYFSSRFFSATEGPTWGGTWTGANLWWGDVVKVNTLGHWTGRNKYVVPITGAHADNLVVSSQIEDALMSEYPPLPPSLYNGGPGLAVRGDQLIQMGELTCNDTNNAEWPWFIYVNIFDRYNTRIDYPFELQRIKSVHRGIPVSGLNWTDSSRTLYCDPGVGAFAAYAYNVNSNLIVFTDGTGVGPLNTYAYVIDHKVNNDSVVLTADINGAGGNITNDSVAGEINLSRADIPRKPNYAQYDDVSGKTYLANGMGACDAAQNFMYILPDDTVVYDVGYNLKFSDVYADCTGHWNQDGSHCELNHTWDAASPPGEPIDQIGACCVEGSECEVLSQTACAAANGFWQGKGTLCGQFPCPGQGACCRPCTGECEITYESECTPPDGVWRGMSSACDGTTCSGLCSPQPMDNDCDGDVDQADFAAFQVCFNPGVAPPPSCKCFDKAGNPELPEIGDADLAVFVACASGPGITGDLTCADAP